MIFIRYCSWMKRVLRISGFLRRQGAVCRMVLFLFIVLLSGRAEAGQRIDILMFSSQARYQEAILGFKDALKDAGFGDDRTEFVLRNADGNKAKASDMVQQMAASPADLILTVGTHATLAVIQQIKRIPVVFTQVYDPVEAGIAHDLASSGNNSTGSITKLPMSTVMESLKLLLPVQRLGVLYTPGEKNSESQLKDLQSIPTSYGIRIVPAPLTRTEDIPQLLPLVIGSTDALYLTGSNLVDSQLHRIMEMAIQAKRVTITHLEDLVKQGVLIGVVPSSYLIGRLAGEKAVKIFQGAQPSSIPIEPLKAFDVILNLKTAKAGEFTIPPEFMKTVEKTVD